jgi:hypothetical protein
MKVQLVCSSVADIRRSNDPPLTEREMGKVALPGKAPARDSQDRLRAGASMGALPEFLQGESEITRVNFHDQRFSETTAPQPFRVGVLWE